jgi:hypothetical protein
MEIIHCKKKGGGKPGGSSEEQRAPVWNASCFENQKRNFSQ